MEISVIIPTRNRANELKKTLESCSGIRREGLCVSYIIVDNGSSDNTREVVRSFEERHNITYLYDPIPGKCHALNMAIKNVKLGEIVIFTDDDVTPSTDWLIEICSTCRRWPSNFVFGGRINAIFPECKIPVWAAEQDPFIDSFVFAGQNISEQECIYKNGATPFGPNFWVRREVLDKGYRFNEKIGPGTGIMSEDRSFLLKLAKDGYSIVFSPKAIVGHRIRTDLLKLRNLWRRAFEFGRSTPYLQGLSGLNLYKKNKILWQIYMVCAIFWNLLKVPITLCFNRKKWVAMVIWQISWAANHYESLMMYKKSSSREELIFLTE